MTLRFVTELEKTHANADALLRIDYETNKEYSKSERRPVEVITIATNLTFLKQQLRECWSDRVFKKRS